jgi:hypothetical protein
MMFTISECSLTIPFDTEGSRIALRIYLIYLFLDSTNEPGKSYGSLNLNGKLY